MRVLATILFLALVGTIQAQPKFDSLILTKEQNHDWILRLEQGPRAKQLELVRKRILLDTNIYINQYYADGITIDNDKLRGKRVVAFGRPLLIINEDYVFPITNETATESIMKLSELLVETKIKSISVLKGKPALVLYGESGKCGVVLLTTTDHQAFKQIKTIN